MTIAALSALPAPPASPRAARQRLPATVRSTQILDAALRVFSERGFAASRIDDIAAAAGLSKGGIYTHFKSKEEIFEALLARLPMPSPDDMATLARGARVTVDLLVAQVIEPMYALLQETNTLLTLRLLLADGARVPEHTARWREAAVDPYHASIERLVQRGIRQGALRKSVLTQASWLLLAPGVHAMLDRLVRSDAQPALLAAQKKAHIAMLRELLEN